MKKVLEVDRNNILVYCIYAQTMLRLESYQVVEVSNCKRQMGIRAM